MKGGGKKGKAKGKSAHAADFQALAHIWSDRKQDLVAPLLIAVLTIILFREFLFSSGMLFGSDTLPMGYAARKVYSDLVMETGTLPLWNPYLLGGIPMVDGLMGGDMFYPTTLLQFLMPVHRALGLKLVIHIFLAGWLFYLYVRSTGCRRPAALAGGTGYAFAPYIVSLIYAGHDGKLFVTALLPLGFLALDRLLRRARFADMLLFGLSIGLMILTAHLQLAFFACGAFGLRFLWKAIEAWRRGDKSLLTRVVILFVAGALLGAALGAIQTWPAYKYTSAFSPRAGGVTYDFAISWSIHWEETVSMLLPEFGSYLDNYWGENPFKLNCESPGFLIMFLAIAGFFRVRKDRELIFWYVLMGITLIYGLGGETPFFRLIYAVVPKFFRAPSTVLFLFSFASAVIAARVLDSWMRGEGRSEILKGFALSGTLVLVLLMAASGGESFFRLWGNVFRGGLSGDRLAAAVANGINIQVAALIGLVFAALLLGLLEGGWRKKIPAEAVAGGLAILIFASDYRTDSDFIRTVRLEDYIREDATIREMRGDPSMFRAVSFLPNFKENTLSVFGIEGARGFFDNRIRWYDELVAGSNLQSFGLMSLINIKYLLLPPPGMNHPNLEEVTREGDRVLYRNKSVLPRAFLAEDYEVIGDREALLSRLLDDGTDLRRTVFLEEEPPIEIGGDGPGNLTTPVTWLEKGPNRYAVRAEAAKPSVLFLSNNYLPYWKALVDGEPAKLLRANYAFQGVALPAGSHEVSITYRSGPYEVAKAISIAATAFLILGGSVVCFGGARAKREKDS